MLSDYFNNIEKVEIYAMIAFFIFFVFFIIVTIHTIRLNKNRVEELSKLPLDDGTIENENEISTN